jgi:oligopeptide/dipeptide ABC transporter ATP-binding protein
LNPEPQEPVLRVRGLHTHFQLPGERSIRAVQGVDLELQRGEVLALVGESGSGKSVTALSLMGLVDAPGRIVGGEIHLQGEDLRAASARRLQALRGERMAMIFQQPRASLNPVQRIGEQVAEPFIRHRGLSRPLALARATELLERVEIPEPARRARDYPHQLSGGQAQRVMIAIALALQPALLIADEPTTALDVTVQAQVLALMQRLCREQGSALLLVTHDLGVVAQVADRVAVMYAGRIVEQAGVLALFENPQHPYTRGLLEALPVLGRRRERLADIPGLVPVLDHAPSACTFAPRCAQRLPDEDHQRSRCLREYPLTHSDSSGASVACWRSPAGALKGTA